MKNIIACCNSDKYDVSLTLIKDGEMYWIIRADGKHGTISEKVGEDLHLALAILQENFHIEICKRFFKGGK